MARKAPAKPPRPKRAAGKSPRGGKWPRRARLFFWINLMVLVLGGGWYLTQSATRQAEVRRLVANSFAENKRVSLLDVAWDVAQFYTSADFVASPPVEGDRTHLYGGAPRVAGEGDAIPAGRFLRNTGYLVGYEDEIGAPLWVGYRVKDIDPLPRPAERPGRFAVDGRTVAQVDPDAYTNSGYDRGHLAPNFAIATRYGETAQKETFLMSNILPQRPALNTGLWKQMEMRVATSYPARFGEVWVLAGPVFKRSPPRLPERSLGLQPAIPEAFYFIITDESDGQVRTLAFLFPQEPAAGAKPEAYLTTVDEIERRSGLDFFAELPLEVEAALESRRAAQIW